MLPNEFMLRVDSARKPRKVKTSHKVLRN